MDTVSLYIFFPFVCLCVSRRRVYTFFFSFSFTAHRLFALLTVLCIQTFMPYTIRTQTSSTSAKIQPTNDMGEKEQKKKNELRTACVSTIPTIRQSIIFIFIVEWGEIVLFDGQ